MKSVPIGAAVAAAIAGFGLAFAASFAAITQPGSPYLETTAKIDFAGLDNFSTTYGVSDGTVAVSFSTEMSKREAGVPGGGWAYWGALPEVESTTPAVLYTMGADSLVLALDRPVVAFGFELEPNWTGTHHFSAEFRHEGVTVGTVTREIVGNRTALLFAAEAPGGVDEVRITSDVPGGDFAIAQLRYRLDAPGPEAEPAPVELVLPAGGAISVNAGANGMVVVVVATTPAFDAMTIDPASAAFGPGGAREAHGQGHAADADGDGDMDLVLHFRAGETGLACGATEAAFTATTFDGEAVAAMAPVAMKGCGKPK